MTWHACKSREVLSTPLDLEIKAKEAECVIAEAVLQDAFRVQECSVKFWNQLLHSLLVSFCSFMVKLVCSWAWSPPSHQVARIISSLREKQGPFHFRTSWLASDASTVQGMVGHPCSMVPIRIACLFASCYWIHAPVPRSLMMLVESEASDTWWECSMWYTPNNFSLKRNSSSKPPFWGSMLSGVKLHQLMVTVGGWGNVPKRKL